MHFIKTNRSPFADHLLCEARGLAVLREAAQESGVDVPQVFHVDEQSLAMTCVDAGRATPEHWTRLGIGLAAIHENSHGTFGFQEDNYIGLNPQSNGFHASWGRFFLERRLQFQVGLMSGHRLQETYARRLEEHAARLREYLDAQCKTPSLLHGDLWNGNAVCGADGSVWLVDPAVYFGDPDADIAMTEMFGGFGPTFYSAYRTVWLESGEYPRKRAIYNLYHYLNHLNLFGDAYLDGCEAGFAAIERI